MSTSILVVNGSHSNLYHSSDCDCKDEPDLPSIWLTIAFTVYCNRIQAQAAGQHGQTLYESMAIAIWVRAIALRIWLCSACPAQAPSGEHRCSEDMRPSSCIVAVLMYTLRHSHTPSQGGGYDYLSM